MDALRAREQLRRRYLFPPDAEVPLDRDNYPRPGKAFLWARSESRRGSLKLGPRKRPAQGAFHSPTQEGLGFVFSRLPR